MYLCMYIYMCVCACLFVCVCVLKSTLLTNLFPPYPFPLFSIPCFAPYREIQRYFEKTGAFLRTFSPPFLVVPVETMRAEMVYIYIYIYTYTYTYIYIFMSMCVQLRFLCVWKCICACIKCVFICIVMFEVNIFVNI